MPWRLYDWECIHCQTIREDLVPYVAEESPPSRNEMWCKTCDKITMHHRLIACPAKYLYDRPLNPMVAGGNFDTMGYRQAPMPKYPSPDISYNDRKDYYNSKEHKAVMAERKAILAENKVKRARAEAIQSGANISMRDTKLPGDPKVAA
jgi:hypothetical protein